MTTKHTKFVASSPGGLGSPDSHSRGADQEKVTYGGYVVVLLMCAMWLFSSYMILQEGYDSFRLALRSDAGLLSGLGDTVSAVGAVFVALLLAALALYVVYRSFCSMSVTKTAIVVASTAAVLAAFYYGTLQLRDAEDRKIALARAVSTLPPGTEAAWIDYVDRRFAGAIQRRGDVVRVATWNKRHEILDVSETTLLFGSGEIEISRNTPYEVRCDPVIGGTVYFDRGDDRMKVPIYGYGVYLALMPIPTELKDEEAPPLTVDRRSIAAELLSETLCKQISVRLQEIMEPQF